MKIIFVCLFAMVTVALRAQTPTVLSDSTQTISGLSSKVPGLLVPAVRDSTRIATRSSHLCNNPHGLFIIDDKEVPCDSAVSLKVENIEDIRVLNLVETHELYGTKGDPYGAIIFITKKYAAQKSKELKEIKKP